MIKIFKTDEFSEWYDAQNEKTRFQIDDRLSKIQYEEHFGVHRFVGTAQADVWELKWKNGRRLYYAYIPEKSILILFGGGKNAQQKDIGKAKRLFKKYIE
ncbi:MAG: type II toxin-antitoxin system RelE/ParE family toxin [Myxococcales bacterium]|nr:type II toxin-antitoxin system RelE/ParE family toxin [Myxococcales bacterium]